MDDQDRKRWARLDEMLSAQNSRIRVLEQDLAKKAKLIDEYEKDRKRDAKLIDRLSVTQRKHSTKIVNIREHLRNLQSTVIQLSGKK